MRRHLILTLAICGALATAVIAAPQFAKFRSHSGAVASYLSHSGTNSTIEVEWDYDIPFRLAEVTATTNGIATDVTINRIRYYESAVAGTEVVTNFHGLVLTNSVNTYTRTILTNEVYDSTSDTLPDNQYFLNRDILQADFGSVTNVTLQVVGTP